MRQKVVLLEGLTRDSLHSKAAQDLERLFPNKQAHIPDGNEDEPSSDADDDFDVDDPGFEPVARRHWTSVDVRPRCARFWHALQTLPGRALLAADDL